VPSPRSQAPGDAGAEIARHLRERRSEIEQTALARVHGVSDPRGGEDPEYASGLRAAVAAAVDYGIAGISGPSDRPPPIPPQLLAQARRAAHNGVGLDTVLRRYLAGYMLLGDFLIQAAQEADAAQEGEELRRAWRGMARLFDRLLGAVAEEHGEESAGRRQNAEQRRAERVRRLLAGELLDVAKLDYDLGGWHLGAIATGPGARVAVRDLAKGLGRQLLLVQGNAEAVWAWLGGQQKVPAAEALRLASACWSPELSLALGEASEGIGGWRLTHRQARAAAPIATCGAPTLVSYADVALLASALGDEVLAASLRETYLAPLERERDGGVSLMETLRAYFAAGRNISSAAAALGASRQTVKNRLSLTEQLIARPLDSCAAELETALRLSEMDVGTGQNAKLAGHI
jgi:PucR C-terminal helix-turn-helix domain/GGDEF-like domain